MIISYKQLKNIRVKHKGKRIVLGSGVFDLFHLGHAKYIQALKKYGEIVVVMVKSDARVKMGKGSFRPILPEADRVGVVDRINGVDYVFVSPFYKFKKGERDPMYEAVLSELKPDVFYSTNPVWKQLEEMGLTKVVIGKRVEKSKLHSTTAIIEHVLKKAKKK